MKTELSLILTAVIVSFLIGCQIGIGKGKSEAAPSQAEVTTETRVDTVYISAPQAVSATAIGVCQYVAPMLAVAECADSIDSVAVELPIVQQHYADSAFEAWVSGPIDPRLDSVRVYATSAIITQRVREPAKRWHIGVSAGYSAGPKGAQPYVGVGITYSLISF